MRVLFALVSLLVLGGVVIGAPGGGREPRLEIDEFLAGFVLYRDVGGGGSFEYLLLKKSGGDQEWQPAKGHVDEGETAFEGAEREVWEETGLRFAEYIVHPHHLMHQYTAGDGTNKQVDMWPAAVRNPDTPITLRPEHSDYMWANISGTLALVNKRWRNEVFLPTDAYLNTLP